MKAAIIGAGFAGNVHAAALRGCGVEIGAVICLAEKEAEAFAKKWNIPVWGEDIALAFREDIDAIHICTPPTTHGKLIREAIEAGKHVLCEKPLCLDAKEAEELAKLAESTDKICALVLNVRYHMACQRAREIMAKGDMGRPVLIHGNYMQEFGAFPAPLDWRYNPKIAGKMRTVTELGTHWLDIVQFITKQKVCAVSAQFGNFHPDRILKEGYTYASDSGEEGEAVRINSEDAAIIQMRYENGALGSLLLSGVSPGRGNHLNFEITCEYGNLWWDEENNNILHTAKKGLGIQKEIFAFGNGFSDTFADLMQHFYRAVAGEDKDGGYPGIREGAEICKICCAIYDSANNSGVWTEVQKG